MDNTINMDNMSNNELYSMFYHAKETYKENRKESKKNNGTN